MRVRSGRGRVEDDLNLCLQAITKLSHLLRTTTYKIQYRLRSRKCFTATSIGSCNSLPIRTKSENEVSGLVPEDFVSISFGRSFHGVFYDQNWLLYDKVTVLESEKRAWETSPESQAIREALNPWRNHDTQARKDS